jgi:hypothetical protein
MAGAKETRSPAQRIAGPYLHILDRDRSAGGIGVKRSDTQTTRRQARRARYTGFVSRETGRQIAAGAMQPVTACGTQGAAAGAGTVVGLPHGVPGDVGAAQVGSVGGW